MKIFKSLFPNMPGRNMFCLSQWCCIYQLSQQFVFMDFICYALQGQSQPVPKKSNIYSWKLLFIFILFPLCWNDWSFFQGFSMRPSYSNYCSNHNKCQKWAWILIIIGPYRHVSKPGKIKEMNRKLLCIFWGRLHYSFLHFTCLFCTFLIYQCSFPKREMLRGLLQFCFNDQTL